MSPNIDHLIEGQLLVVCFPIELCDRKSIRWLNDDWIDSTMAIIQLKVSDQMKRRFDRSHSRKRHSVISQMRNQWHLDRIN